MTSSSRSPLALIFGIVFIDLVGFGIVIPVLPLYAERFGASPLVIGCLLGIYSAMQCLAAPLLGKLSDRVGRRPVLLLSIAGTAGGFLLMGLANTLGLLFAARIIDGATGGNISTAQAYIADVTPPEDRSRRMGLIGAAFGLGFIFGPAIGGLLSRVSLAAPFFFAATLAAINMVAVFFFLPESLSPAERGRARDHVPLARIFQEAHARHRPLLLVLAIYFFVTVAFSLLTATYPLFTERQFGFHATENGYIFAAQGLLGAIIQGGLLGVLVHVLGDKGLTITGTAILAGSLFLLPMSSTVTVLFVTTAAVAIGHSLTMAPLNGLASNSVSQSAQGRVLGVMQSAASLARIIGPVLGGWLLDVDAAHSAAWFGQTPYWTAGILGVVAVGLSLFLS